jgi:hypothetical protein
LYLIVSLAPGFPGAIQFLQFLVPIYAPIPLLRDDSGDPPRCTVQKLAELYSASVQGRITEGENAGDFIRTAGIQEEERTPGKKARCCASLSGFSLHANVCIPAKARRQLENLCRYVARPAVAMERLSKLPDGRILYHLRHRWHNGSTDVIFDPLDLIGKLAALVPPPRFNMVRYHGQLAPSANWRKLITPQVKDAVECAAGSHCGCMLKSGKKDREKTDESAAKTVRPRNYSSRTNDHSDSTTGDNPIERGNPRNFQYLIA